MNDESLIHEVWRTAPAWSLFLFAFSVTGLLVSVVQDTVRWYRKRWP